MHITHHCCTSGNFFGDFFDCVLTALVCEAITPDEEISKNFQQVGRNLVMVHTEAKVSDRGLHMYMGSYVTQCKVVKPDACLGS